MNPRRMVILIVAVVVAAVAAVGILNYVEQAETSADEAASLTELWVVQQPIPKGTSIEQAIDAKLIGVEETAQSLRPATAVVDPSLELAGLVARTDLPVDWPLVTGSFVSPKVIDTGITERLEDTGLVTVTFEVNQAQGAAYLIEPGDFVNVMVERPWDGPFFDRDPEVDLTDEARIELAKQLVEHDTPRPIATDLYPTESRVAYQKAEVLAIGQLVVPDIGEVTAEGEVDPAAANRSLVTLAVPPEAVQVILNVGRKNLYLSLVPDDYEPRPLPPLDPTTQVLPGEVTGQLTPYAGFDVRDPTMPSTELLFSDEDGQDGEDRTDNTPGNVTDSDTGDSQTEIPETGDSETGTDSDDSDNTGDSEDGGL